MILLLLRSLLGLSFTTVMIIALIYLIIFGYLIYKGVSNMNNYGIILGGLILLDLGYDLYSMYRDKAVISLIKETLIKDEPCTSIINDRSCFNETLVVNTINNSTKDIGIKCDGNICYRREHNDRNENNDSKENIENKHDERPQVFSKKLGNELDKDVGNKISLEIGEMSEFTEFPVETNGINVINDVNHEDTIMDRPGMGIKISDFVDYENGDETNNDNGLRILVKEL